MHFVIILSVGVALVAPCYMHHVIMYLVGVQGVSGVGLSLHVDVLGVSGRSRC